MKKIIMAGALAAAIFPLTAVGAGATSLPAGPAIYPGGNGALEHVTLTAPAEIHTPWGVITDEYGTGETVPPQYGGTVNGKPVGYPGWSATSSPAHVQLNFAVLTSSSGQQTVIEYVQNVANYWASAGGGVEYPTCMEFTIAATGVADWMLWDNGSWVNAPGCVLPG